MARVISAESAGISKTGTLQIEAVMDLLVSGQAPRRIVARQMVGLGELPQPGQLVYVLPDQKDANRFFLLAGKSPEGEDSQPS